MTFEQDANGTVLETPLVTKNPDGSTTIDNATLHSDGSLANETISTTSADGLTKTIAFDDAGNGIIDRRQTDDTVVGADGSKTETASDLNGSGVLEDSTTTATSADGSLVTIDRDLDGNRRNGRLASAAVFRRGLPWKAGSRGLRRPQTPRTTRHTFGVLHTREPREAATVG